MGKIHRDGSLSDQIFSRCVCPVCHSRLKISKKEIECQGCISTFPVRDGIPNFILQSGLSKKVHELSEEYDLASQKYLDSPKSCGYAGTTAYITRLHMLQRWLNYEQIRGKSILDVGCGTGFMSKELVKKNEVWGVDISLGLLNLARKAGLSTVQASAENLPFKSRDFDIVLCVGVIPYYTDPESIFNEICRVSAPRGQIIVSSTANSLMIRIVRFLKNILGMSNQLARLYTTKEMEEYIRTAGGKVVDSCMGFKDRSIQTHNADPTFLFSFISLSTAVLATISDQTIRS